MPRPMLPIGEAVSPSGLTACETYRGEGNPCQYCEPSRQRQRAGWHWRGDRWVSPADQITDLLMEAITTLSPVEENTNMPYTYDWPNVTPTPNFYCDNCDSVAPVTERSTCSVLNCGWALCAGCFTLHEHDGDYCYDCGYANLNAEQSTYCDTHEQEYCNSRHARFHVVCSIGGYEPRDDGRYNGRPPVEGFGREASLDLLDDPYVPDDIVTHERAAALELEVEYAGPRVSRTAAPERLVLPSATGITHDGSLRNGIEVTTPPAKGRVLREIVTNTCEALIAGGYEAQPTCGMHTHIDLREYKEDKKFLSHLFNAFFAVEDILYAMQHESREETSFAVPLRKMYKFFDMYGQMSGDFDYTFYKMEKSVDGLYAIEREKQGKYSGVRYAAFNFHSVFYRGSLECRIHEGNVDAERALHWINLLQTIIARVERGHSYAAMQKLARMNVTPEKVKAFSRYFGLTRDQREWVTREVARGRGFGFRLAAPVRWGEPRRGRPRGAPKQPRFRLAYVGVEVRCYNCGYQWTLARRSVMCPDCRRLLVDRYGALNYTRVPTHQSVARRRRAPTWENPVTFEANLYFDISDPNDTLQT